MTAAGTFTVKLNPLASYAESEAVKLGRMSIDKEFDGDLKGTSKGEMLSAMTPVKGSAGYVAIERVTATLHGKQGSFVLQHKGVMIRGAQEQSVAIVPDSGTGELTGISGVMKIVIDAGHSYQLEYTLGE